MVRWYQPKGSSVATIPLRCGTASGFGLLHFVHGHPEAIATLDADITRTLAGWTGSRDQGSAKVYTLTDLPPCPGYYKVVVEYAGYGSTGIKGVITAYHQDGPASSVMAEGCR